ncbi:MAG: helix-turn-helix transcriptional regulator [Fibrobacter sp.]|nr:helix-turn-helix transcriptional regulator [Fibrobacter sp.]
MEPKFDFGHYIDRKHWKQKDAVAALGVSTGLVGSWASGTAIPSYDKIVKLIGCGITAQELFGEELGNLLIENSLPAQPASVLPPEFVEGFREQLMEDFMKKGLVPEEKVKEIVRQEIERLLPSAKPINIF